MGERPNFMRRLLPRGEGGESGESSSSSSRRGSVLIPGLPNEITLNHILTKVPWSKVMSLVSLGRAWQTAVRGREVYDARARAGAKQTHVAIIHDDPALIFRNLRYAVSLYDIADDSWRLLPKIPGIRCGIPDGCGCIPVNGKLYVIGGRGEPPEQFSSRVYEFDCAGKGTWAQRASMLGGRAVFAYGVKDGKIFVFGGMGAEGAAEVYDPVLDVWRRIAPMLTIRMQHRAVRAGPEFYVHMGKCFSSNGNWHDAYFAEVYDSEKDRWRRVENFTGINPVTPRVLEAVLVVYGRILKLLDEFLYIYEPGGQWRRLCSVSWDVLRSSRGWLYRPSHFGLGACAMEVKGELLALVYSFSPDNDSILTLLRSTGLRSMLVNQPIMWRKIESSLHFRNCHCMCAIDL